MNSVFKKKSITIDTQTLLDDLFCFLDKTEKDDKFIYRGSTNKVFKLIPSLYRFDLSDFEKVEREYCFENDLFEGFDLYIKDKRLEFYQTLQHYGIKTKLLDFTKDPFVGLLFAVCDWPLSGDNSNKDGELIIIRKNKYQSINQSDFELFGDLLFEDRNGTTSLKYDDAYGKSEACFSKEIRFLNGIESANERINRQKGCFLLFPNLSEPIKPIYKNQVYKRIIIKGKLKKVVIKMLKEQKQLDIYSVY